MILFEVTIIEKVLDEEQREAIIQQAPAEQQETLRKLSLHMTLAQRFGGEEGLNREREKVSTRTRFKHLLAAVRYYHQLWSRYTTSIIEAKASGGLNHDQISRIAQPLQAQEATQQARFAEVDAIALRIAPCEAASTMEEKARKLSANILYYTQIDERDFRASVTIKKLEGYGSKLDELVEQAKRLPQLNQNQIEQMRSDVSDQDVSDADAGMASH